MKPILYIISILHLIVFQQNNTKNSNIIISNQTIKSAKNKNSSFITTPCAILIRPNSKKIASLKKLNPGKSYDTILDDNEYYMGVSIQYLDSVKTKIIEKDQEGFIKFKTKSKQIFEMKLDAINWGIILFNGKTNPIEADLSNIDIDYKKYMKK